MDGGFAIMEKCPRAECNAVFPSKQSKVSLEEPRPDTEYSFQANQSSLPAIVEASEMVVDIVELAKARLIQAEQELARFEDLKAEAKKLRRMLAAAERIGSKISRK